MNKLKFVRVFKRVNKAADGFDTVLEYINKDQQYVFMVDKTSSPMRVPFNIAAKKIARRA